MPVGVAFGTTDGKTSYVPIDNDVLLAQGLTLGTFKEIFGKVL